MHIGRPDTVTLVEELGASDSAISGLQSVTITSRMRNVWLALERVFQLVQ